ncbi:MAG: DNA repair protein RecN, partial [Actinomycetota bacterium]|nr:DNA repair protein RecN [Actinomycetota bacterium]
MLAELAVSDLGVIGELSLLLGPGMTALTGETGAGKTLVVTAIELLVGGRADAAMVRPGASEARVGGRFVDRGGQEVVLERVVPAQGRSRAYVDGRLAQVSALAELGSGLVDLHGQHSHQSLLAPAAQRAALDRFGGIDLHVLDRARSRVAEIESSMRALGGDAAERAQLADLLRFELAELDRAGVSDPDEEAALEAEESLLSDASAHRHAAALAHGVLVDEGGAVDAASRALSALAGRPPFAEIEARLRGLLAELADAAVELRRAGEVIEEDPGRLEVVRSRLQQLRQLRRRYQAPSLAELIAVRQRSAARLEELDDYDRRAVELEQFREQARGEVATAAAQVALARRRVAPELASAVQG